VRVETNGKSQIEVNLLLQDGKSRENGVKGLKRLESKIGTMFFKNRILNFLRA